MVVTLLEFLIKQLAGRESIFWVSKQKYRRVLSIYHRKVKNRFFKNDLRSNPSQSIISESINLSPSKKVYNTKSQSGQDIFVQIVFQDKKNGTYLEIGSGRPIKLSNTYVLEKFLHWKGLSVDIDPELIGKFNEARVNKSYCYDGTTLDYKSFVEKNEFDNNFEYLSIDIDPAFQSYFALKKILLSQIKFLTLTFEHDKYRSGPWVQFLSVILLKKFGYIRLAKDISSLGFGKYEDWWIFGDHFSLTEINEIRKKIENLRLNLKI